MQSTMVLPQQPKYEAEYRSAKTLPRAHFADPFVPNLHLDDIDDTQTTAVKWNYQEDIEREAEIEGLKVRAMNNEDLGQLDSKIVPRVLQALQDERDNLIRSGQFIRSRDADQGFLRVQKEYENQRKKEVQKEVEKEIQQKLASAKAELEHVKKQFIHSRKVLTERLEERVQTLAIKHEGEVQKYEQEWQTPAKTRKYSKSSAELRALKQQTLKLLNARRYEEMELVDKKARQLEIHETAEMERAMQIDYQNGLNILLKQQEEELAVVKRSNLLEMKKLNADEVEMTGVISKRIQNLENELSSSKSVDRVWAKKRINYKPATCLNKNGTTRSARFQEQIADYNTLHVRPVSSPRSARRKLDYRTVY